MEAASATVVMVTVFTLGGISLDIIRSCLHPLMLRRNLTLMMKVDGHWMQHIIFWQARRVLSARRYLKVL